MPRYGDLVAVAYQGTIATARYIAGVHGRKAMVELDGTSAMVTVPRDWIEPMTDNVRIYHAIEPFRPFSDRTCLELAYSYAAPDLRLEEIWRWNNTVDGDEREQNTNHHKRSLSVGDVVGVRDFDGNWSYHSVEALGWRELNSQLVDHALEKAQSYDPFEGL